jgi:hypothetical protein
MDRIHSSPSLYYLKKYPLYTSLLLIVFFIGLINGEEIRYAGDMSKLPVGSDIASMGDVGVVLPRRAASSFWNPAASANITNYEISTEYANLYHGLSQQGCLGIHVPLQTQMGVSLVYTPFLSGKISLNDSLSGTYQERLNNENLRAQGLPTHHFDNNQHLILLSVGKKFSYTLPRLPGVGLPLPFEIFIGGNFKGYIQTMNPAGKKRMGVGVNLDAGLIGRVGLDYNLMSKHVSRWILVGAAVRDFIPSEIEWINSPLDYKERVKYSQYYGVSYVDKSGDLGGNWTIALSIHKQYEMSYHAGIEAEFWNFVSFRAGISDRNPTLGAGVHYNRYFLDYAFRFDDIDFSMMRLTVGVTF